MDNKQQGSSGIGLEGFYTSQIQSELSSRLGVETFIAADPGERIQITINGKTVCDRPGPAVVSVNID
ncbi:BC1881 family protein [Asaia spathodeae]|uniref:BC1881 family protein n=1 Tax=Asaia spathodeae TaxID=657016 RepID=UPI002FC34025